MHRWPGMQPPEQNGRLGLRVAAGALGRQRTWAAYNADIRRCEMLDRLGVRLLQVAGLDSLRERFTRGEFWWAIGLSAMLAFTLGIVLVLVTGGVIC